MTKCIDVVDKMQTVAYMTAKDTALSCVDSLKPALH